MSTAIGVLGFLGFIGSIISVLVCLIKKKSKKKSFIAMGICFALFIIGAATSSNVQPEGIDTSEPVMASVSSSALENDVQEIESTTVQEEEDSSSEESKPEKTMSSETDTATMGEKNALKTAESYFKIMAFSYQGILDQLEYEGYTENEAIYAANNCGADWNEQAAKKAKSYLDMTSFSRQGLIDQLLFEGFTEEQAEYGVSQNGY